jgi:hypothetical protein
MSEPIWCNVQAVIPAGWVKDHAQVPEWLTYEASGLCNGFADLDRREDGAWVVTLTGEGNYGLADDEVEHLLDLLTDLGVPWLATQDTKYEITGEIRWSKGDGSDIEVRDHDGDGAVAGLRKVQELGSYEAVVAWLTTPDLNDPSAFPIGHLDSEPPTDEQLQEIADERLAIQRAAAEARRERMEAWQRENAPT